MLAMRQMRWHVHVITFSIFIFINYYWLYSKTHDPHKATMVVMLPLKNDVLQIIEQCPSTANTVEALEMMAP